MSKCLITIGGIGSIYFPSARAGILALCNPEEIQRLKEYLKQNDENVELASGALIAGIIGYCIGKKYYPTNVSSLKNLFSRTALAQKIFNI